MSVIAFTAGLVATLCVTDVNAVVMETCTFTDDKCTAVVAESCLSGLEQPDMNPDYYAFNIQDGYGDGVVGMKGYKTCDKWAKAQWEQFSPESQANTGMTKDAFIAAYTSASALLAPLRHPSGLERTCEVNDAGNYTGQRCTTAPPTTAPTATPTAAPTAADDAAAKAADLAKKQKALATCDRTNDYFYGEFETSECACSHCTFMGDPECKSAGDCEVDLYTLSEHDVDRCDEIDSYGESGECQAEYSDPKYGFKYTCVPVNDYVNYCEELRDAVRTAQGALDGTSGATDGASGATAITAGAAAVAATVAALLM